MKWGSLACNESRWIDPLPGCFSQILQICLDLQEFFHFIPRSPRLFLLALRLRRIITRFSILLT
jgi:hypothetical protein